MRLATLAAAAALLVASAPARAEEGDYGEEQIRDDRNLSLTLGVLSLLGQPRFLSGTAEFNLAAPVSLEGTAGLFLTSPLAVGLGAGARAYFFGQFDDRGAYLGARAMYVASSTATSGWVGPLSGLTFVPSVGGKVVRFGLTFDGNIGVQFGQSKAGWGAGLILGAGVGYTL